MKKRILYAALLLMCLVLLSGCCDHQWEVTDCELPKTCALCGEVSEDEPGHTWAAATCTKPETCSVCGKRRGVKLSHTWHISDCNEKMVCTACGETSKYAAGHQWQNATCTTPQTCTLCGETQGEAMGHFWSPATCAAPSTCYDCGETQGEAPEHDWSMATCAAPAKCYNCGVTQGEPLEHVWTCQDPPTCHHCGATGETPGDHRWMLATTEAPETCFWCGLTRGEPFFVDPRFKTAACDCVIGAWRTEVNIPTSQIVDSSHIPSRYMTQNEVVCIVSINFMRNGEMILNIYPDVNSSTTNISFVYLWGVYYVEDSTVYMAMDWNQPMTAFTLARDEESDTLTIEGNLLALTQDTYYRSGYFGQKEQNHFTSILNPNHTVELGLLSRDNNW